MEKQSNLNKEGEHIPGIESPVMKEWQKKVDNANELLNEVLVYLNEIQKDRVKYHSNKVRIKEIKSVLDESVTFLRNERKTFRYLAQIVDHTEDELLKELY